MNWVDEFLDSWEAVEKTTDWRTAKPFPDGALTPYYYNLVVDRVLFAIDMVKDKRIKDLTTLFPGPSSLRTQLVVLFLMKYYGFSRADRMKLAKFYYDGLVAFSPNDPFTYNGTNFMYTKEEIKEVVKKHKWLKADIKTSRELAKLSMNLSLLSYALFTDSSPSVAREVHGPYDVSYRFGKNHVLIVRDYFYLKPVGIWPTCRNYRCKSVKVLSVYKDLNVKFDYYGNFTTKDNLIGSLEFYAVLVDNKPFKDVRWLRDYIGRLALAQDARMKRLSLEGAKKIFVECDLLHHKRLFEAAGIGFERTRDILLKQIKGKKLLVGFGPWGPNKVVTDADIKQFRKIMDPRTYTTYKTNISLQN